MRLENARSLFSFRGRTPEPLFHQIGRQLCWERKLNLLRMGRLDRLGTDLWFEDYYELRCSDFTTSQGSARKTTSTSVTQPANITTDYISVLCRIRSMASCGNLFVSGKYPCFAPAEAAELPATFFQQREPPL